MFILERCLVPAVRKARVLVLGTIARAKRPLISRRNIRNNQKLRVPLKG